MRASDIPYTLEVRADTGTSNTTLGFWLFIASEVMLFGALFSAYALLRVSSAEWPSGRDVLNLPLGATNTVVLLALTASAWRARATMARARPWLVTSTALAILFLALKSVEYRGEIAAGVVPAVSTFIAIYFALTGLHALHVAGGALANVWALTGLPGPAMTVNRVRLVALYWAFVDAVWIVIFVLLYLS